MVTRNVVLTNEQAELVEVLSLLEGFRMRVKR